VRRLEELCAHGRARCGFLEMTVRNHRAHARHPLRNDQRSPSLYRMLAFSSKSWDL
jgi:hypothetical protein